MALLETLLEHVYSVLRQSQPSLKESVNAVTTTGKLSKVAQMEVGATIARW